MMTIFSPIAGRISDKVQPRYLATAGMTLCTLGLFAFGFLRENTPIPVIVMLLMGLGLGFALFSSPNMNTIMSSVNKQQYGIASGISATMRIVGQMVSMTIVTFFYSIYFGAQQVATVPNEVFIRSTASTFFIFALISTSGIWFSFSRGNVKRCDTTA